MTRNSTTAIDNIITNSLVYSNLETSIIRTDISDHFQIFIFIKISTNLSTSSAKVSIKECFMNWNSMLILKSNFLNLWQIINLLRIEFWNHLTLSKNYGKYHKLRAYKNEHSYKNFKKFFEVIKTKTKKSYYLNQTEEYKNGIKNMDDNERTYR